MAVYNAQQWLSASIGSLISQTMTDWQLICIDDASTDGSLTMLREWEQRDNRIKVIALAENGGQAHARNIGLKKAQGDYICFLDADDTLSVDALQQAVNVFESHEKTDCVLFRVKIVQNGVETPHPSQTFEVLTGVEAFNKSIDHWQIHGIYMIRAALHHQYPYDETCRSYSDDNTTHLHYYHSREVRYCEGIYYYWMHSTSVTHRVSVRRFDYMRANESLKQQLIDIGASKDILAKYENQRWLILIDCYMFYHVHGSELTAEERRYGLSELHRIWATIDRTLLCKETIAKFGYRPCASWLLFRLQEWLYFTLRDLLGKNN